MLINIAIVCLFVNIAAAFTVQFEDQTITNATVTLPGEADNNIADAVIVHGNKVLVSPTHKTNIVYTGKENWNKWFEMVVVTDYPNLTNTVNISNEDILDQTISYSDNSIYGQVQILFTNEYGLDVSNAQAASDKDDLPINTNNVLTFFGGYSGNTRHTITAIIDSVKRSTQVAQKTSSGNQVAENITIKEGSLRAALTAKMDAMISGEANTFPSRYKIWSTMDHDNTNYVWNTDSWFYNEVDLTCLSPWSSAGSGGDASRRIANGTSENVPTWQFRTATLITPQHAIAAAHFHPRQGPYSGSAWQNNTPTNEWFQMRFVAPDGTVHQRVITDVSTLRNLEGSETGGASYYDDDYYFNKLAPIYYDRYWARDTVEFSGTHDIAIIRFNEPLPNTIKPAKIFPKNYINKLPELVGLINALNLHKFQAGLPIVYSSAERYLYLSNNNKLTGFITSNPIFQSSGENNYQMYGNFIPRWTEWGRKTTDFNKIRGDSGNALGFILGNDFIVTGTFLFTQSAGGLITDAKNRIELQIQKWGDTDTLTEIDISSYPTYNNPRTESGTYVENGVTYNFSYPFVDRSRDDWVQTRKEKL